MLIKNIKNNIIIFGFFTKLILIIFLIIIFEIFKNKRLIKNFTKPLKVCLCVIGKKENLYVKEFINYYKKLGYNKIFIYDNNDIFEEKFEDVIKNEINQEYVSVINYRGYQGKNNHPQFDAYKDCYEKNNKKFDWLSFFDFDEFLEIIQKNETIQDFLNNKRFQKCQIIKINWIVYNNIKSLYYEKKPLQERVKSKGFLDIHIKSTVRGNLPMNYWSKTTNPHSSINKYISCSSSGKIINFLIYCKRNN